jgi:hypothetical protein
MSHEIVIKIKRKEREEEITLRWFASLMGAVLLEWFFPLSAMTLGVFSGGGGRREGVK